jgi:hypothetical protein
MKKKHNTTSSVNSLKCSSFGTNGITTDQRYLICAYILYDILASCTNKGK